MKLIINTSTLSATGPSQVAVSFLNECRNFETHEYHVFLSKRIDKEIDKSNYPSNFFFYLIPAHPIYGLKGFAIRRQIRMLEKKINPDVVFSVFGPSCWTPKVPHLQGYAYPHYVYPESPLFSKMTTVEKMKVKVMEKIHMFFLRRNGNYYVSETEDVSQRLVDLHHFKRENVYTASNTYNDYFENFTLTNHDRFLETKGEGEFRFLSLCSFAQHKNLPILNKVIPLLNKNYPNHNIKFVLTVDPDRLEENFSEEARASIINLGRVDVSKCPQLYLECDALFLPTTLECFSANYPEAMKMGRPILTSNLAFATSVCGEAALYFDPYDEEQIVSRMIHLYEHPDTRKELVQEGKKQLSQFLTPRERAEKYLKLCGNFVAKK